MARTKNRRRRSKQKPIVIRITRHLTGPPRRSPGQMLRMTVDQIRRQDLVKGRDYLVVSTE